MKIKFILTAIGFIDLIKNLLIVSIINQSN